MRLTPAWLGWRSVRHRPGSVLGAAIALAISASLVSALAFIYSSANLQEPTVERFAGAPLVVAAQEDSRDRIPDGLADTVRSLPEVGEAVPEVTFPATVLDADGRALRVPGTEHGFGHGWGSARLTPLAVSEGEPPRTDREVVVDRPLADQGGLTVGQAVTVVVLGTVEEYRISGIAAPADGAQWRYQSALFFEDSHAESLKGQGPNPAGALAVFPAEGTTAEAARTAVERRLAAEGYEGFAVLTDVDRGLAEGNVFPEIDRLSAASMLTLMMWAVIVTTGVVAGAIGLAVRGRSAEIAMLRAVGATPWQVRLMVAGEAAVLSGAGLLVGLPLGAALAGWIAGGGLGFAGNLSAAFQLHHPPAATVLTAVFIIVSAQVSGLIAARHALRIRPADALTESATEGRRLSRGRIATGAAAFGGSCIGALVLTLVDLPEDTLATYVSGGVVVLAVIGSGLLAPWLVRATTDAVRALVRRIRPESPGLAVANVAFYHRRFAGVAGPLLLGITLAGTAGAVQLYQNWLAGDRAADRFASDFVVVATAQGDGFHEASRTAVEDLASVSTAVFSHTVTTQVSTGGSAPIDSGAMVVYGDAREAVDLDLLAGGFDPGSDDSVMVTVFFADSRGLSVGDRIAIAGSPGEPARDMTVSGVYGGNGFLNQQVALGAAAAATIGIEPGQPDGIFVEAERSNGPEAAGRELAEMFPSGYEGAPFEIHDRAALRQAATDDWAEQNRGGTNTILLIGLFLVLGAANSISVAQFDRRREFASMRMLGISRLQRHVMVALETVLTVVLVFALSALVTLWIALLLALGTGAAAQPLLMEFLPVGPVAALGGAALVFSLAGAVSATRSVHRSGV